MKSRHVNVRCAIVFLALALVADRALGQVTVFAPGFGPNPTAVSQAPVVVAAVAANSSDLASNGVGATIALGVAGQDVPVSEKWNVDISNYEQFKTRYLETDSNMTVYLATRNSDRVNITSFTATKATAARTDGDTVVFSFAGVASLTANATAPAEVATSAGVSLRTALSSVRGSGAFLAITVRGDDVLATSVVCKVCEHDASQMCCIG